MSEDIEKAIQRVDGMLRRRKDKMRIIDCLAISTVLKELQKQSAENARLREANAKLIEALKIYADEGNWSQREDMRFGDNYELFYYGDGDGFRFAKQAIEAEESK